jgi:hypothetical protein
LASEEAPFDWGSSNLEFTEKGISLPEPIVEKGKSPAKRVSHSYNEQEKRDIILLRIWTGSIAEASRQSGASRESIKKWIDDNPQRYNELLENHKGFLDKHTANRMRSQVLELLGVTDGIISDIKNDLKAIPPEKRPEALNKVVWSMDNILKANRLLEDKPSAITSIRPAREIVAELKDFVDSTVVEDAVPVNEETPPLS